MQGITTVVTGNCGSSPAPVSAISISLLRRRLSAYGISSENDSAASSYFRWRSMADYLDVLEQDGVLMNTASLAAHGAMRYAVMGDRPGEPTPEEMDALAKLTRRSLDEGAFGLSTGLGYEPGMYAETDELLGLLRIVAEANAVYTVHSRSYSIVSPLYPADEQTPHNVLSTREQLELARKARVRLQLSHLLFHGRRTWPTYKTVLADVEQAVDEGLDIGFDSFPYTFGNTTINVNFPKWFLIGRESNINDPASLRRLEREMEHRQELLGRDFADITLMHGAAAKTTELDGMTFDAIARHLDLTEFEAYMHIARISDGRARILQDTYSGDSASEEPLRAMMSHPLCSFMTDTLVFREGYPNRATYGTYPRILGHYVRDVELFSLEEAVRKMTTLPAAQIGLEGVGEIKNGHWADLVLFDPESVTDNTTPEKPSASPTGIRTVLISGQIVAQDGKMVGKERHGRVMRR
jgi:N-acyl-D-amino-acid deacylase